MELSQYVETAIAFALARGLKLNFARWNKQEGCYFKITSPFFGKKGGLPENYFMSSCCVLGAVLFMDHAQKNDQFPIGDEKREYLVNIGWSRGARILEVDDNWVLGLTTGWDAVGLDSKTTEINWLREHYNSDAYDLGVQLREKYDYLR